MFWRAMSSVVRFAMATTPQAGAAAVLELGALFDEIGLELQPVFVPSYRALYDSVHLHEADAAWCPPIVARDLRRDRAADACAAVLRNGSPSYFSAIVGTAALHSPSEVHRFGWVSQLSAAGYLVPRSYLASLPKPVDFREERFFHTHARCMEALKAGIVDAIATYATYEHDQPHVPHAFEGAKVLTTIGPIPGDVIVLSTTMPAEQAERVREMLIAAQIDPQGSISKLMGTMHFGPVPHGHLESLSKWIAHPVFTKRQSEHP
jgi:ABC-type phosphate/phosphonate transport system substrate-binding protein